MRPVPQPWNAEFDARRGEKAASGLPRMYALADSAGKPRRPAAPAHAYANVNQGSFLVGLTSILIIPRTSQRRNFLSLRNSSPGTEVVFVAFNTTATTSSWLRLEANQIVLFDTVVPQDDVHVVSDTATGRVSYGFGVLPRGRG